MRTPPPSSLLPPPSFLGHPLPILLPSAQSQCSGALHPQHCSLAPTWFLSPRWLSHKCRSMRGSEARDPELRDWQRNYRLNPVYTFSLFDEFMEMSAWAEPGLRVGLGAGGPLGAWSSR